MKNPVKHVVITVLFTLTMGMFITAFAQNARAQSAINVSGTSWTVVETDTEGSRDIFNFLPDGTLSYSYQPGSFTNGKWKQNGNSIYIEMNNKFVEYQGRISGTHIEGTASNIKGNHWTWTADMQSAPSRGFIAQGNSSVPSIAGTTWAGPDTMGRHYTYEFLPDGTLRYIYENGNFTDATWKQDGDSIYMSINNKFSERLGRIIGTHMEGNAWNTKGQKWTWTADKRQ
jgi:hypothetical protein